MAAAVRLRADYDATQMRAQAKGSSDAAHTLAPGGAGGDL